MKKAAVIQMVSSASVAENLKEAQQLIHEAKEQGAVLLVLPENFAFMGLNEVDKKSVAEQAGSGAIQQQVAQMAKKAGIWIIAGTIPVKGLHDKVRASSMVFDDKGLCAGRYDKIHLFDVRVSASEAHQESSTVERGDELVVVDTPVGHVGLSVCYDLRFAEMYHQLAMRGAELFAVPSAFTAVTGKAHWHVLLRARAIENLAYVLASNQGGVHENKRVTYGHSMIIDPWGRVLAEHASEKGIISAEIDLQTLYDVRRDFPCHTHHVLGSGNSRVNYS